MALKGVNLELRGDAEIEVWHQAKIYAARIGIPLKALVLRGIRRELSAEPIEKAAIFPEE